MRIPVKLPLILHLKILPAIAYPSNSTGERLCSWIFGPLGAFLVAIPYPNWWRYRINYRILRADEKTTVSYFGNGNFAIPTIFFINRDGLIVNKGMGFIPGAVEKSLTKILK